MTEYQLEELNNIRRQCDRLKSYGEHIEDHSVITVALHIQDTVERIIKNDK